ncbi:MAG TPA: dTDP-4-dehydrorhamnose 3,5-epimerase [Acidimicrobiales bacterium]|nr:dTDP-4-dehydrorhamnose 3,5-epimerase [Acidimicrobiales bacterium]
MLRPFSAQTTDIADLLVLEIKEISDDRGVVREFFRTSAFEEAGVEGVGTWLQVNVTESVQGAVRGLHGEDMYKLVGIAFGEAFGAYVDTRPTSPTRGSVVTLELRKGTQVLVPPGVCNGFQSVSDGLTQYLYCFTQEWAPNMAGTAVNPLDPALGIAWPIPVDPDNPAQLSAKDRGLPTLAEVLSEA